MADTRCVTHHHACDCREARFAKLQALVGPAIDAVRYVDCEMPDGKTCTDERDEADWCEGCRVAKRLAYAVVPLLTDEEKRRLAAVPANERTA